MLIAKDKYSIAVLKALGFTNLDISKQYVSRSIFVLIIGIVFGTILANTFGEILAGLLISGRGISSLQFVVNPITTYLVCPLILICVVFVMTKLATSRIGKIKISENIKE